MMAYFCLRTLKKIKVAPGTYSKTALWRHQILILNVYSSFDESKVQIEATLGQKHVSSMLISVPYRGLMMIGGQERSKRGDAVEILVNNKWVPGPTLPVGISAATVESIDSDVFIFGGDQPNKSQKVFMLARGENTWREVKPSLKIGRASHSSVLIGSKGNGINC